MVARSEIRQKLVAVVRQQLDLADFEEWLDERSWNMHSDSDPASIQFAEAVLLRLSEFGLGYRDERSLRSELFKLLNAIVVSDPVGDVRPCPVWRVSASPARWKPVGHPVAV